MKVSGKKIRLMALVSSGIRMETNTKGSGRMNCSMVKDTRAGQMDHITLDAIKMA